MKIEEDANESISSDSFRSHRSNIDENPTNSLEIPSFLGEN